MQNGLFDNSWISKGYVVFEPHTNLWWLQGLKPGFRHCYLLLEQSTEVCRWWLEVNPMSNQIMIFKRVSKLDIDYISYLEREGNCLVLPINFANPIAKCAPLGVFSCVEFMKRILGIHNILIITPYQLYNYICNNYKL